MKNQNHLNSKRELIYGKEILSKEEIRNAKEMQMQIIAILTGFFLSGGIGYLIYLFSIGSIK